METYDVSVAPHFRQILSQRQADLRAIVRTISQESEAPDETVDSKDVATDQELTILDDVKSDHAVHELEQVLAALRRLDDQSYGRCLD